MTSIQVRLMVATLTAAAVVCLCGCSNDTKTERLSTKESVPKKLSEIDAMELIVPGHKITDFQNLTLYVARKEDGWLYDVVVLDASNTNVVRTIHAKKARVAGKGPDMKLDLYDVTIDPMDKDRGGIASCAFLHFPIKMKSIQYNRNGTTEKKKYAKFGGLVKSLFGDANEANIRDSLVAMKCIDEAVVVYRLKYNGRFPQSLRELVDDSDDKEPILEGGAKAIIDPWDNEYKLEKNGKRHTILSAGPDGIFDTEDDIRSDRLWPRK